MKRWGSIRYKAFNADATKPLVNIAYERRQANFSRTTIRSHNARILNSQHEMGFDNMGNLYIYIYDKYKYMYI